MFAFTLWHAHEGMTMSTSHLGLSLESPAELLENVQPPFQRLQFMWLGVGREVGREEPDVMLSKSPR